MAEEKKEKKIWKLENEAEMQAVDSFAEDYMKFLDASKTEREAAKEIVRQAEADGFKDICKVESLKAGDKVYYVNHKKSVYMAVIGQEPVTEGFNAVGAHIDCPRLDIKQNPIYEDSEMALMKTHYYGGIKKYQWTTVPLALHGVVILADGTSVDVNIGEEDADPIFLVTDLLPHLAAKQEDKKMREAVAGEALNLVIGSMPLEGEESESVKKNVLKILKDKYGIEEADFVSAELEAVPAMKARFLGIDRGMVAGYGQDDRVCAYPALRSVMEVTAPKRTTVCLLADKEEIGSVGNTGMQSQNFELFIMMLLEKTGIDSAYALQKTFSASNVLSADVTAAFDPNYPEVMEKNNSSFVGRGVSFCKYTGARGKSGSSDANAEFLGHVRKIFLENGVSYQSSELGKVDEGGGGTIAYILADRGMNVLDCGVPILSMHSPYEAASKYDIYMAYKGYKAFMAQAEKQ